MAPKEAACPLCARIRAGDFLCENAVAVAIHDGDPVSPGHALILPRRHVADVFSLSNQEQAALWSQLPATRLALDDRHRPAAYNIGVNDGQAAGQTVPHVHGHLNPRYAGDVADPRVCGDSDLSPAADCCPVVASSRRVRPD
jgi:ATP adenylyltransferase